MRALYLALGTAFVAGTGAAQSHRTDPDEFVKLQPVLRRAIDASAPWVVSVETFGGTRKVLVGQGGGDGPGGARPPRPQPKPKKDEKPKLGPLKQPGFLQSQGATTGIVLSPDGWILVSRFALNFDPTTILVTMPDGTTMTAERFGEDTSRGIALLKVDAEDLPTPKFVHPRDVHVGQWAFALGRTFARTGTPTVHMGIVSAAGRQFGRALQIDAYTSPANYGGPVIDLEGRVLGISVPLSPSGRDAGAEWYDSGIGFAATIADIPELIDRMKAGERLHRGWLGIQTRTDDLGPGAEIRSTPKAGAAKASGLRKGDRILEVDGIPVQNPFHLQMLVSSRLGGDTVHLKVHKKRDDEDVSLTVFLQDVPYEERRAGPAEGEFPSAFPWDKKK